MATKKTTKKAPVVQPMSIQEFKIWIKGLSAFQDENWFPNKAQWEHITLLIDNLVEVPVVRHDGYAQVGTHIPLAYETTTAGSAVAAASNPQQSAPAPRFLINPATVTKPASLGNEPLLEPFGGSSEFR